MGDLVNLALGKTVIVSSNYSDSAGSASGEAITNGTISTGGYQGYWSPANSTGATAYATVDLGESKKINFLRINILAPKFSIAISEDNIAYEKVVNSFEAKTQGWYELSFEKKKARYIKVFEFDSSSGYGYNNARIFELELYLILEEKALLKSNKKVYSFDSPDEKYLLGMTSHTTPSPYVISASSNYSSAYANYKAFDGLETTAWLSNGKSNQWIQIDFGTPTKTNRLEIYSGGHNVVCAPKDFQILGSLDGVNFTEILNITGTSTWVKGTPKIFEFPLSEYRYYRIFVSTNMGGANYVDITEIYYGLKINLLTEIPKETKENYVNYGQSTLTNINGVIVYKDYVLQRTVSEDTDGLRKQAINRKPLSIKFE